MDQTLQRIDRPAQARLKKRQFFRTDWLQDIISRILKRCGPPNPDFNADKLRRAERLHDGFDSIVPTMAASDLDSDAPWLEIQIIVNDDQLL